MGMAFKKNKRRTMCLLSLVVCEVGPSRGLAVDVALLATAGKGGKGGLRAIRSPRALLAHARLSSIFR